MIPLSPLNPLDPSLLDAACHFSVALHQQENSEKWEEWVTRLHHCLQWKHQPLPWIGLRHRGMCLLFSSDINTTQQGLCYTPFCFLGARAELKTQDLLSSHLEGFKEKRIAQKYPLHYHLSYCFFTAAPRVGKESVISSPSWAVGFCLPRLNSYMSPSKYPWLLSLWILKSHFLSWEKTREKDWKGLKRDTWWI